MNSPQNYTNQDLGHSIGYELLGPVVHRWLLGLEQHVAFFGDGDTRFLFCARAGVRIKELYKIYIEGRGRSIPDNMRTLWVSRLALCKGLYSSEPNRVAKIIEVEYQAQSIRTIIQGLLRHAPEILQRCDLTSKDLDADAHNFGGWLTSKSSTARLIGDYLEQSSRAFNSNLDSILSGSSKAVLIDSGWQGTGQSLLHHGRPDVDWYGLYIGRILTPSHDHTITDRVIGLLFQAESFDPKKPETAVTLHRHLFETLLEPNAPSIEEVIGGPCDNVAKAQIAANKAAEVDQEQDRIFLMVREYLRDHTNLEPAEILSRHQAAMPKLARILANPSRQEALSIFAKDRSADFGKDLHVPVLISDGDAKNLPPHYANRDNRIQHSLWPQGQIALEFDGKLRTDLQLRATGLTDDTSYFDFAADNSEISVPLAHDADLPERPLVAIITRTKNRPLLLKRAAESVAHQTYDNYLWVIVNDGGDEDVVRDVIDTCSVDRRRIRLVSNTHSLGMEAASNAGVSHSDSDYVIIHDDDDTLHPDFLKKTVEYLESPAGKRYGGVVTGSDYVSEEVRGDSVIEHSRTPYMSWVRNIQLAELMAQNLFAPIAFAYRRKIYDEIGGYNPELPVLGDWYFNLEFVLRADIKILPETLAYYHHRDQGDSSRSGVYSNSVIGGQSKHEEFASVCRNMFLRQYANKNAVAAGLVGAYYAADLRHRLDRLVPMRTPQQRHQTQNIPESSLDQVFDEADRLWLLSQVLHWRKSSIRTFAKRSLSVQLDSSFEELADIIRTNKLRVSTPASFDDELYLRNNPDVQTAVKAGVFQTGFQHYVSSGRTELRARANKSG